MKMNSTESDEVLYLIEEMNEFKPFQDNYKGY